MLPRDSVPPAPPPPPAARALAAAALGLLLAACGGDAPTTPRESSPAYDPRAFAVDETGAQQSYIYHWPVGATVRLYVDGTAAPPASDLRDAVADGAAAWSTTIRQREFTVVLVTDLSQADVVVHYGEAPRLVGSGDCAPPASGGAGSTFLCPDFGSGTLTVLPRLDGGAGHVKMDVAVYRSALSGDAQFRRAVAHELGHVLGIGSHSPSSSDLMFGSPSVAVPSAADGRTLRYVLQQEADLTP